jgi:hypothetical protein
MLMLGKSKTTFNRLRRLPSGEIVTEFEIAFAPGEQAEVPDYIAPMVPRHIAAPA